MPAPDSCTGWDAYTRDADGRVVVRSDADGEHLYIGDHYELHNGLATSYYLFGGRRVALREGTAVSHLFADHLGSTRVVDTGADTPAQQYTPWGEIVASWANTLPTEYTYTGQREASATGELRLLDYGARHYMPWVGRFISPDTIVPSPGNPQSLNRYAYALNNPLRYTDPTGMFSEDEIMTYLDVDTWEEVLGMFEEGGQFAGRWGVLQLLRQAHLGDKVGIYQTVKAGGGDSGFWYFLDQKRLAEGILRERDGRLTLEGRGLWDITSFGKLGDVYFHNACFTCGGPMSAYEKRNAPRVQRNIDWVGVGFDLGGVAADAVSFGAAGRVVNAVQVAKSAEKIGQALNVTSTGYDLGSSAVELYREGHISGATGRSLFYSGAGFIPGLGTISDAASAIDGIFYWGP